MIIITTRNSTVIMPPALIKVPEGLKDLIPPAPFPAFPGASTSNYQHDANGNTLADGEHTYRYDARSRLVDVDGGNVATYHYNALGQRIAKVKPSGGPDYLALAEQAEALAASHAEEAQRLEGEVMATTQAASALRSEADQRDAWAVALRATADQR
ncbi:hypothetical protein [Candidatus Reidiella endopervernicosa]|uniref:RHS repeat protein n=1 Tax=Candidatus Reidiella endopervernicosa TaxID=2738883 RepID=A0A6N0HZM2_9GAMM|nr:hypothetical protein [Candidatus Reidiella endopervernicosa]QKQ27827.1 hypothetical protein HUE57_17210 [Candidatus Reidiella endopervernicosa]